MTQITDQQWADIRTLHEDGGMRIIDAVLTVKGERKRKVRAPTMAELDQIKTTASQRGASNA